jgi:hypothetical protein
MEPAGRGRKRDGMAFHRNRAGKSRVSSKCVSHARDDDVGLRAR